MKPRTGLLVALVVGAAVMRLLPHPANFTPVAALALFAGAHFQSRRVAFLVPLSAMLLSDAALQAVQGIGLHSAMPAVYASFAAVVAIGRLLSSRARPLPVATATVASSVVFFIATNFAVWLHGGLYASSWEGLVACYIAAIPFFSASLLGDLFYAAVLFGGLAAAERRFPALASSLPG